jgi:hypothetical protein
MEGRACRGRKSARADLDEVSGELSGRPRRRDPEEARSRPQFAAKNAR